MLNNKQLKVIPHDNPSKCEVIKNKKNVDKKEIIKIFKNIDKETKHYINNIQQFMKKANLPIKNRYIFKCPQISSVV